MSLKEGERLRHCRYISGINIIGINSSTPTPQQTDNFWAYEENKHNLQLLARESVCKNVTKGHPTTIASSMVCDGEVLPAITAIGEIPELLNWIEEADARIVVHIGWAVRVQKCE